MLAIGAGLVGTWIVLRGLAFYSHAVGTAAFPGLVLADGLGFSAHLGAAATAAVVAAGVGWLARRDRDRYDSSTALVLVAALAVGVILASDVFHSGADVENLLFGSLLVIGPSDVLWAAGAGVAVIAGTLLLGHRWTVAGFDPTSARALGVRSAAPRRGAARPRRPGGDRGALGHRRAPGHRPARRPRRHHAAAVLAPAPLAARERRAGRARGRRRPVDLGRGQRAARRRHRRAQRRGVRARGRRPRAARRPAGRGARGGRGGGARARAARRRLRRQRLGRRRPAERRRDHHPARRPRPQRRRPRRRCHPDPAPQHRPARVRAAALRRARHRRGQGRVRERRRPRQLDGQGPGRGGWEPDRGRPRRPCARPPARRSIRARGLPLRPPLVARPPQRRGRGRRHPRRAQPRRPGAEGPFRAQRRRLPGPGPSPRCRHPRLLRHGAAGAAQAGHRPRRLRLLRPPLRRAGHRRRHPVADHPGAAQRRRHREAERADPARAGQGGLPRDARSTRSSRRRWPARPAPPRTTTSTATRWARRARRAPPTWAWSGPMRTRWSAASREAGKGARSRACEPPVRARRQRGPGGRLRRADRPARRDLRGPAGRARGRARAQRRRQDDAVPGR